MDPIRNPTDGKIPDQYVYVAPRELGRAVSRSRAYIYERINRGDIAARRVAGALRIPLREALAWIERVTE